MTDPQDHVHQGAPTREGQPTATAPTAAQLAAMEHAMREPLPAVDTGPPPPSSPRSPLPPPPSPGEPAAEPSSTTALDPAATLTSLLAEVESVLRRSFDAFGSWYVAQSEASRKGMEIVGAGFVAAVLGVGLGLTVFDGSAPASEVAATAQTAAEVPTTLALVEETSTTDAAPATTPPPTALAGAPSHVVTNGRVSVEVPLEWQVVRADATALDAQMPIVSGEGSWTPGIAVLHLPRDLGYDPATYHETQVLDQAVIDSGCTERERHYFDNGAGLVGTYLIADRCDGVAGQSTYLVVAKSVDGSFTTLIGIGFPTDDDSIVFSTLSSLAFS